MNMYLDERSEMLLNEIIKRRNVTSKKLQIDHNLTRRQINYSLDKINEWLEEKGFNKIEKYNGYYIFDENIGNILLVNKDDHKIYIPSPNERKFLIILYILMREEALSLNHFISEMEVSKNTVLQDLKEAKKILKQYKLVLDYTRSDGYYIVGEEWNKRSVLLDAIYNIKNMYGGEHYLFKLMSINPDDVNEMHYRLSRIENELCISFTDAEIETLPYSFFGIIKRILTERYIKTDFFIDSRALSDTREFEAIKILIEEYGNIPEEEQLYLTLQLLTSSTIKKTYLKMEELPRLKFALLQTIEEFEKKALLTLTDKKLLVDRLFLHFQPAYYRIKYKLTTDYRPVKKVSDELKIMHYFIKESISPLEKFLKCEMPESEIMFITLFIVGHIVEHSEQKNISSKFKAIVVCPNGLSISKLMRHKLQSILPEIYFYPAMSIREFDKTALPYDIVFSARPISVAENKKTFIVNQMMDESEALELRKIVMNSIFPSNVSAIDIDKVLKVITEYAEVTDEQKLMKNLKGLLQDNRKNSNADFDDRGIIHLSELITKPMIQMIDKVNDWQEGIEIASHPLIETGKIDEEYVKAMKDLYPSVGEEIVLQKNIAIPHAETERGVKQLGMSLLYIKNGIPNFDGSRLNYIVVIAATDKKKHFTALIELMELAGNKSVLNKIADCKDEEEIYQIICHSVRDKKLN